MGLYHPELQNVTDIFVLKYWQDGVKSLGEQEIFEFTSIALSLTILKSVRSNKYLNPMLNNL